MRGGGVSSTIMRKRATGFPAEYDFFWHLGMAFIVGDHIGSIHDADNSGDGDGRGSGDYIKNLYP